MLAYIYDLFCSLMTNTESDSFSSLFFVPSLLVIMLYKKIITQIDLCVILVYNLMTYFAYKVNILIHELVITYK